MKTTTAFSLLAAASLALSSAAFGGSTKDYQVTGPILEMNDSMIAVQKGQGSLGNCPRFEHEVER